MKKLYKKILLATDGSDHAHNAAKKAVEFQKIWDSEVVVIHSIKDNRVPSELYPNIDTLYEKYSSIEEVYQEAGERLLNKTKKMFGENQSSVEIRLIEKESPEDYIRRVVEQENFDLVILGSRGQHSKVKNVLLGTVSSKVSKNAPCDVLIVK